MISKTTGASQCAVLVVDRSLRETNPGVYATTVKLPASGKYDVAFLADSPRIAHCFEAEAEPNPLQKKERQVALRIEHQIKEMKLPVGSGFHATVQSSLTRVPTRPETICAMCGCLLSWLPEPGSNVTSRNRWATVSMKSISTCRNQASTWCSLNPARWVCRYRDLPHLMLQAIDEHVCACARPRKRRPPALAVGRSTCIK